MAMCAVIGQFDSFPYSIPGDDYFVYADPARNKLVFMPWGMDETFMAGDFDVNNMHSILATTCQASPSCWSAYKEQVWSVLAVAESHGWEAEAARVAAQIAPYVAADPRKPYTAEQVATFQNNMHWFIDDRWVRLEGYLP
jgi:hypothetical protein